MDAGGSGGGTGPTPDIGDVEEAGKQDTGKQETGKGEERSTPPEVSRKGVYLLGVVSIVCALAVIGMVVYLTSRKGGKEDKGDDAKDDFEPPPSVLGNYSKWAAATDAAPCVNASRWMYGQGGNAFDAAVATLLCHTLASPNSNGIGGGFMATIYLAKQKKVMTLIARETAPAAATENMYAGEDKKGLSRLGGLAVGVPGELRGYEELVTQYGKKNNMFDHYNYTIKLAEKGVPVGPYLARDFHEEVGIMKTYPEASKLFLKPGTKEPYEEGEMLKNPDLKATYEKLQAEGIDYFYKGELADRIVKALGADAVLTKDDLEGYQIRWADPLKKTFKDGRTMYSLRPPGGGALVAYVLGIMDEMKDKEGALPNTPLLYHRYVEALKFTYAKRTLLGDEEFATGVKDVVDELTSQAKAAEARKKIDDSKTHSDTAFYGLKKAKARSDHGTSHSCYWDEEDNVVALTSTINYSFGSMVVPENSGFLLNNQMDDFSTPGMVNIYNISPSTANYIAPGKRPQSSTAPTIIMDKDGRPQMCFGGSGGSRITTGLGLIAMRALWQGRNIKEAIDAPRVHHQLLPARLEMEDGFPDNFQKELREKGHDIEVVPIMKNQFTGIFKLNGRLYANADFRKAGEVDGE